MRFDDDYAYPSDLAQTQAVLIEFVSGYADVANIPAGPVRVSVATATSSDAFASIRASTLPVMLGSLVILESTKTYP